MRTRKRKATKASLKRDLKKCQDDLRKSEVERDRFRMSLVNIYQKCLKSEHSHILDITVKTFTKAEPFTIY